MPSSFDKAMEWLNERASEAQFFRCLRREQACLFPTEGRQSAPPTLKVVNEILDTLNRPDRSFQHRIIIGGTAGKGTVCRLVEDTLERQGLKTACLMSPHLQAVTERIRIGGRLISKVLFGECVLALKNVCRDRRSAVPTYYETIVLAGLLAAQKSEAQVLIGEIGMGGQLDAVNAVQGKRIAALTFVGDDHLEFFDHNIEKLAEEKAGIFTKDSVLNLSCEQKYCSILNRRARRSAGPTIQYLKGVPKKLNKKIARNICEAVLGHRDFQMQKVPLPARWEVLKKDTFPPHKKTIILDGAHARARFEYRLPKLKKIQGQKIGVFAMAKNHDPKAFEVLLPYFDTVIWTQVPGERAFWETEALQALFGGIGEQEKDPFIAFEKAQKKEGTLIVLGSFYLCGLIRELFYPAGEIMKNRSEFL